MNNISFNRSVLVAVLGGGGGTRLFPLTKDRAKPAVPLGGKYRLVDIPISNCLNSGLRRIYVLTQFNSASLHRHISQTYRLDNFSNGFVEILAAQQTTGDSTWYQGTADAIRKNLIQFRNYTFDHLLILSGDQLYRANYDDMLRQHQESNADVTIATIPIKREEIPDFGIMQLDETTKIIRFVEKPRDAALQDSLSLDAASKKRFNIQGEEDVFLASMGIYVFKRSALEKLLDNQLTDFGHHVIPLAIETTNTRPFVFQGYWQDLGTIQSFFDANLDLTKHEPSFDFYDAVAPIFSRARALPPTRLDDVQVFRSIIADGCLLDRCKIRESVVGIRSIIGEGSQISRTVLLGCDYYETNKRTPQNPVAGKPRIGIGRNSRIENAIIDKNARIGDNVVISPSGKSNHVDHPQYYIRDGIVIIPKNQIIPSNTII